MKVILERLYRIDVKRQILCFTLYETSHYTLELASISTNDINTPVDKALSASLNVLL